MALGVIGRKAGMTRVHAADGAAIPVTVIEVLPNRVAQLRTAEGDGYRAVQLTTGSRRATRVAKAQAGHFAKAGVEAGRLSREFRLATGEGAELKAGDAVNASVFSAGQKVDVTGTSIGKGHAGNVKRHHFRTQDSTHGNSRAHRAPGSIGQRQTPGRVFPGKRMSGHLGNARRTAMNLTVVSVDVERNLLLVEGAVPGARGGNLLVRPAARGKKKAG
jgi:large subunit ribosomal protein L3